MADPLAGPEIERTARLLTSAHDQERREGRAQLGVLLDAIDLLDPEERHAGAIGVLVDLCHAIEEEVDRRLAGEAGRRT